MKEFLIKAASHSLCPRDIFYYTFINFLEINELVRGATKKVIFPVENSAKEEGVGGYMKNFIIQNHKHLFMKKKKKISKV